MTVGAIKDTFNSSRELVGHRDCRVNGVSALKGYLLSFLVPI